MPKLARSLIHREAWFSPCFVSTCMQNQHKEKLFLRGDFRPLPNKKCSILRPLLSITFPQGFRISKNLGHPTSGSEGKIGFKI